MSIGYRYPIAVSDYWDMDFIKLNTTEISGSSLMIYRLTIIEEAPENEYSV